MTGKPDGQGLLKDLQEKPFDSGLHQVTADWFEDAQNSPRAHFHRFVAELLASAKGRLTLFARPGDLCAPGPEWERLTPDQQLSERSLVARQFRDHPHVEFLIVSDQPLAACGLRAADGSPIAHWHRLNGHYREVVPDHLLAEREKVLVAVTAGTVPAQGRSPQPGSSEPGDRPWGENATPRWLS